MEIKVMGPGCARCEQAYKVVSEAVAESGLPVKVVKITDMMEMAQAGVMSTPAVMVDGKVVSLGKAPSKAEVLGWLKA
jgi:small redox-active disulfide protein 2